MKHFAKIIVCLSLVSFEACRTSKPANEQSLDQMYENAVKDVMYADNLKIDTSLIDITPENKRLQTKVIDDTAYVLVLTWLDSQHNYPDTGKFTTDSNRYLWVTVYPELVERMKNQNATDVDIRLRQLLGLPPNR